MVLQCDVGLPKLRPVIFDLEAVVEDKNELKPAPSRAGQPSLSARLTVLHSHLYSSTRQMCG